MASTALFYTVLVFIFTAQVKSQDDCDEFQVRPMDKYANVGDYTCLDCDFDDDESNVEQWIEGSDTTVLACSGCFVTGGNLCFENISIDDYGIYKCFVTLGFGVQQSCLASLLLADKAVFDVTTSAQVVAFDDDTFTVSAELSDEGNPPAELYFQKNGVNLTSLSDSRFIISEGAFTLTGVTADDRGPYQIVAENLAGKAVHQVDVSIEFVSAPVITESTPSGGKVTLVCRGVSYPSPTVEWVKMSSPDTVLPTSEDSTVGMYDYTVESTLEIDEGCDGTEELYRCKFSILAGARSKTASVVVCPIEPPDPPVITIRVLSQSSVEITWPSVTKAANYILEWRLSGTTDTWSTTTVPDTQNLQTLEIPDLTYNKIYEFRAQSVNSAGKSPYTNLQTVRIIQGIQDPVLGLQADLVPDTTLDSEWKVELSWMETTSDDAEGYKLHVFPSNADPFVIDIPDVSTTSYEIEVECVGAYSFMVQVVNSDNQGANSSVVTAMNCVNSPEPPTGKISFTTVTPRDNSIEVSWEVDVATVNDEIEKLTLRIQKLNENGAILLTNNYTVPNPSVTKSLCAGKLESKTRYQICLVGKFKLGTETECLQRTTTDDVGNDPSGCLEPNSTKLEQQGEDSSSESSAGIPDWGIAVIVVGVLALVALFFCLIGVGFACQSNKKSGGTTFGSASDISMRTDRDGTMVHMQSHRPMSPSRSCLSYHSKGHSTNWNDHVETLRQLESGAATSV